ncbi:hypothetical protein [Microbacterium sp. No. 7]|uniref:hypothetical protein n=1 Tax=Microbacterium sp. No. 7 TaxID=1714373 RepID=UPI0006D24D36|nr:hypothetical protein [Microbacterium sp. No. 7]ALJ18669.1 hypothetical protein AOA12_01565 [Microbacterium sp. No. 7]
MTLEQTSQDLTAESADDALESTDAVDADDAALDEEEGSAGSVWVTIGLFVAFIVGVSGCFAFQVF